MHTSRSRDDYDVVCIGTSPLVIMEALHHDRMGKKTLLIDAASRLGGAWCDFQVFGLKRVEIAPHFLRIDDVAYAYLQEDLGIPLTPMVPQPKYLIATPFRRVWLSYSATPWITFMAVPLYCLRNPRSLLSWTSIKASLQRVSDAVRLISRQFLSGRKLIVHYPPGGTLQLMDRLVAALKRSRIEVKLRQRLESVESEPTGPFTCQLSDQQIKAKQIVATEHQQICAKLAGTDHPDSYFKDADYVSLHVLVKTSHSTRTAFVQTKGEPEFNLLSDLTSYTKGIPAGHRLLVIRLTSSETSQDRTRAEAMLKILVDSRYVADDTELVDFHFSSYRQGTASEACLQAIAERFGSAVTVLRTTCLSASIGNHASRWKERDSNATIPFRSKFECKNPPIAVASSKSDANTLPDGSIPCLEEDSASFGRPATKAA